MQRKTFIYAFAVLLMIVTGCSKKDLNIELTNDQVEAGTVESACELVKSVNGLEVNEINLLNNTLLSGTQTVSCKDGGLDTLGETILIFESNKVRVEKIITVVDTTAPVIHIDQSEIGVEVNNEFFNIKDIVKVTDTFDKNVSVSVDGSFDINTPGTYDVQLIAKDSSGNTANKSMTILVKEKEKEIVTVVEEKKVFVSGSSNNGSENSKPPSEKKSSSKGSKPGNRKYLFSDGYNMETAPSACKVDLMNASKSGWGGECRKIGEAPNIKGMELVIYD